MLWQSKRLKQERDREESIEIEREIGEIEKLTERQTDGGREREES